MAQKNAKQGTLTLMDGTPVKPSSGPATSPTTPTTPSKQVQPQPYHVVALALIGAALGILSGLNGWPDAPATMVAPEARAHWLAFMLGGQNYDTASAAAGGLLGAVVGAGFAASFFFPERKMVTFWVCAGVGLIGGGLAMHTMTGAAGGWILGWLLAMAVGGKADPASA